VRRTAIFLTSTALLAGTALTGPAVARDRTELTATQMTDRAGFASAMQDMNKKQADRRIAMRDARAQQHGTFDVLDQMRKNADRQIERSNERKKFADAAQPLYASLNAQQKNRFADSLFGSDRGHDND
jgi:hypothetical protein